MTIFTAHGSAALRPALRAQIAPEDLARNPRRMPDEPAARERKAIETSLSCSRWSCQSPRIALAQCVFLSPIEYSHSDSIAIENVVGIFRPIASAEISPQTHSPFSRSITILHDLPSCSGLLFGRTLCASFFQRAKGKDPVSPFRFAVAQVSLAAAAAFLCLAAATQWAAAMLALPAGARGAADRRPRAQALCALEAVPVVAGVRRPGATGVRTRRRPGRPRGIWPAPSPSGEPPGGRAVSNTSQPTARPAGRSLPTFARPVCSATTASSSASTTTATCAMTAPSMCWRWPRRAPARASAWCCRRS